MKIKLLFTVLLLNVYLMTIAATPPNATISYNSPFCQSSTIETVTLTGTGNYLGGTFSATPGLFVNSITGAINPSSSSPGIYSVSYFVAPSGSDPAFMTTTNVTILAQPNAGTDAAITVCDVDTTVIDLQSLITGEQSGGTWTRIIGTGGTFDSVAGTFSPALGATTSSFAYTIEVPLPCEWDTSVATVSITSQPNAGTNGSMTVCESSTTTINLFSLIVGEQSGGTWTRVGAGGTFNAAAGTFTPAPGATSSSFIYTLLATFPCSNDTSVANVIVTPQPNAGLDGSINGSITTNESINLFSIISGEQPGGTWTRTSGVGGTFNAVSGTFNPYPDATTSTFTYTLVGAAPCNDDFSIATIVVDSVVPLFSPIGPLCSGQQAPFLPSVSTNGITGSWSPAIIDTTESGIYVFTPDPGQSADMVTLTVIVILSPTATVVVPDSVIIGSPYVATFTGTPNSSITYQINGGPNQIIVLNNTGQATIFFENAVNSTICLISAASASSGCNALLNDCVTVNIVDVPAPIGNPSQTFAPGATLADVVVTGTNIQWYDGADRNVNLNPLPLSTILVNGATYYASQTINGYESPDRLAVTVEVTLTANSFDFTDLTYGPNPVENILNISSADIFRNVTVYNCLGQVVYQHLCATSDLKLDLGFLIKGNYFIKLESDNKSQVIAVIKE
jgi:hypothetical protein